MSKPLFCRSAHLAAVLSFALALYGCAGSNESGSPDSQPDSEIATDNSSTVAVDDSSTNNTASIPEATTDSLDNNAEPEQTSAIEISESTVVEDTDQGVPLPTLPVTTRVDFDITVPAFSSDELQVIMRWGDIREAASWVADQYWTLSVDFPLDTENALAVTFYDGNGAVTLASYQATFRTGFNSTDSYQIHADQFDSASWDTDSDGISNLDESILGGDSVQLELRDAYFNAPHLSNFDFGTSRYESRVPVDRPYYEYLEVLPENARPALGDITQTLTIDISEAGNGNLDNDHLRHGGAFGDYQITTDSATRTNTGDSVIWEGYSTYNSQGEVLTSYLSSVEIKNVNAQTRRADGTYTWRSNGSFVPRINLYEYALVGESIADSSACEPSSGTLLHAEYLGRRDRELLYRWKVNKISKGVDDQLWTVSEATVETEDAAPINEGNPDSLAVLADNLEAIDDTYLTRALGATFYCDYPEFD